MKDTCDLVVVVVRVNGDKELVDSRIAFAAARAAERLPRAISYDVLC